MDAAVTITDSTTHRIIAAPNADGTWRLADLMNHTYTREHFADAISAELAWFDRTPVTWIGI